MSYIVLINNPEDVFHPSAQQYYSKKEAETKCKWEQKHGRTATLTEFVCIYPRKKKVMV